MATVEATILQGDCIERMREVPAESVDLVFADPPFNIGYQYDAYHDQQTDDEYLDWSRAWMQEVHRLLTPTGTFWLAIGDEYAADLKVLAQRQIGFTTRSWVVWYYTFGVNCTRKFSRSHAHLFHFVKDPEQFTFNADDPAVRVPSARALVYGDKRANPKGRLPDDTWILRPQDFQSDAYGFSPTDDTWYFARVAGTFKERQGFHGCQMPEQLLGRIIRVSSNAGERVFDPFTGSGTTLAVAKKLGREYAGCELSTDYVRYACERLDGVREGDPLDGPADAIASAPTTANGRRLAKQDVLPLFDNVAPATPMPEADRQAVRSPVTHGTNGSANGATTPVAEIRPTAEPTAATSTSVDLRQLQRQAIGASFTKAAAGRSVDRLLADPQLQEAFHNACAEAGLLGDKHVWNRELLRLRKSGGLSKTPSVSLPPVTTEELDRYQFAAEIAWQQTGAKFKTASIDDIFAHPEMAAYFDRVAARMAPGFAAADYRWAALDLRKSRHQLTADAEAYDYVFATRELDSRRKLTDRAAAKLAGQSGVYLLSGAGNRPLYVGESLDLGARLVTHATAPGSRNKATSFAILPDTALPSSDYRAPLKVHLVIRHQPGWNVY